MSVPRKRPRQQRSRETVTAILESAAQLFERDGYERTTTNHVADRAGVSIGTLYQYFPNKDSLLYAIGEEHVVGLAEDMGRAFAEAGASDLPLRETVADVVRVFAHAHLQRPALHRILYDRSPRPGDTAQRLRGLQHSLGLAMAARLRRLGATDEAGAEFLGLAFIQGVEAHVHGLLLEAPTPSAAAARLAALEGFWVGALTASLAARAAAGGAVAGDPG
ncbi:TetR/AcrR family transcriptional regulator [Streptomyces rubiginosohelvolus]|uniref:TetR/AcrR family transcriptional regulator n=1 Tax=Streptomyces rubiginosohelvolus TaxID=67362 RepID=UPI0036606B51